MTLWLKGYDVMLWMHLFTDGFVSKFCWKHRHKSIIIIMQYLFSLQSVFTILLKHVFSKLNQAFLSIQY